MARPPAARTVKILRWHPHRNSAGTVLGYFDVQLASGMIVNGCKLMTGPTGKYWVAPPSQQQTNKDGSPRLTSDGRPVWKGVIEFADKAARDRFCETTLRALRAEHPDAFGG